MSSLRSDLVQQRKIVELKMEACEDTESIEYIDPDDPEINNQFQKLLDAEFEYENKIEAMNNEIDELKANKSNQSLFDDMDKIQQICGYFLDQLIPTKLNNTAKSQFGRVFYGYLRKQYKNKQDTIIPMDIINTIIEYYPIVIYDIEESSQTQRSKHRRKVVREKEYEENERENSIEGLHRTMFQKLLDAEWEYETEILTLRNEINRYKKCQLLLEKFELIELFLGCEIHDIIPNKLTDSVKVKFAKDVSFFTSYKGNK